MKSVKEVFGDESDVYDGLRLRFSIYTHNRVLEFRSGTTSDTPLESLRERSGDIRWYYKHHCQPKR
ncbi:hypothetical protein [Nostoc sp.]|uniref:hypothetical protein n=1 Tax=Nostoc sp. TaxID=1180 RepID=UPI002FFCF46A